jgi:hypothetical protein
MTYSKRLPKFELTEEQIVNVNMMSAMGFTLETMAQIFMVDDKTLKRAIDNCPNALNAYIHGKNRANLQVAQTLYEKALAGDTTAMIFWLKNRAKDVWKDKQEISNVEVIESAEIDTEKMSDEDLKAYHKLIKKYKK